MSASTSHTVYVKGRPITAKATADGDVSLRIGSLDGIGKGKPGSEHVAVVMTRDEADAIAAAISTATLDAVSEKTRPAPKPLFDWASYFYPTVIVNEPRGYLSRLVAAN